MKTSKKMCRISDEDWDNDKKAIRDRVRHPEHICRQCFRVSRDKAQLCKPKPIK